VGGRFGERCYFPVCLGLGWEIRPNLRSGNSNTFFIKMTKISRYDVYLFLAVFVLLCFFIFILSENKRNTISYESDRKKIVLQSKIRYIGISNKHDYIEFEDDKKIEGSATYLGLRDTNWFWQTLRERKSFSSFAQVGDSISKAAGTDTFYLYKNGKEYMYSF